MLEIISLRVPLSVEAKDNLVSEKFSHVIVQPQLLPCFASQTITYSYEEHNRCQGNIRLDVYLVCHWPGFPVSERGRTPQETDIN